MRSSGKQTSGVYGQGGHAGALRALGKWLALAKINYVRLLKPVELYQPMILPQRYQRFLIRRQESARAETDRYDYVVEKIAERHTNAGHIDVGCQFGVVPLLLAQRGLYALGVEFQYFSYLVAKELTYLNEARLVHIINADITTIVEELPRTESLSMLSILHHLAHLLGDRSKYEEFLRSILGKVRRLVVLELAAPDEGKFAWVAANREICGEDVVQWHTNFLTAHGFSILGESKWFPTHLGGSRPIIGAERNRDQ